MVLFALHSLRRATFFQNRIYLGFSMETRMVKFEMDPRKNGALFRSIKLDVGGRSVVLVARAASRRSWFVRHMPHIESRAAWRRQCRLPRL